MKFCLVVDDSDVIRKVARKVAEGMGHIVIEAATAEEGLDLCTASMPDMILLDWQLPDMSAFDFLEAVRTMDSDRVPQILYCTTDAEPQDLSRAYRAGINAHILKPFDRQTLEPKIAELQATVDAFA